MPASTVTTEKRTRVGELRPSQLLLSFGVGATVDLPSLSVMVMGLDDWPIAHATPLAEARLLAAVQKELGSQVTRLLAPPPASEEPAGVDVEESFRIGVPVAPFPRWLLCPFCRLLAPIGSGLFQLKANPWRPDQTRYIHHNCRNQTKSARALPVRFLVGCELGHLDDFPWVEFVHGGPTTCAYELQFSEEGMSGEAVDVYVRCVRCNMARSLAEAFGERGKAVMPSCRGRRPQLRDFDSGGCTEQVRPMLLGASNAWFPVLLSALTIPSKSDKLSQLVEDHWPILEQAKEPGYIAAFRAIGKLGAFAQYSDQAIWDAIQKRKSGSDEEQFSDIKTPEYQAFLHTGQIPPTRDFQLRRIAAPAGYEKYFERVVAAERLREVRALLAFTRIESPNDFGDLDEIPRERRAPICRKAPTWVPASEVRGEGLFLQFDEAEVRKWLKRTGDLNRSLYQAHRGWRAMRKLEPLEKGYPTLRFVLLHSFAHALIRQFSLECGYSAASLRERIFSRLPEEENGPMSGVLIYTSAPDSEGTLGGLVSLAEPRTLGRHIDQALEGLHLCTSDPLCAEHVTTPDGLALHGACCHACLFLPETSCERGNKYLDRSVLVKTVEHQEFAFFEG